MVIIQGTKQEVYNYALKHFAQQQQRAILSNGDCRYRTKNGLKCVIGAWMSDEDYKPEFEDTAISALISSGVISVKIPDVNDDTVFLQDLQEVHDTSENLEVLQSHLANFSKLYELDNKLSTEIAKWS